MELDKQYAISDEVGKNTIFQTTKDMINAILPDPQVRLLMIEQFFKTTGIGMAMLGQLEGDLKSMKK